MTPNSCALGVLPWERTGTRTLTSREYRSPSLEQTDRNTSCPTWIANRGHGCSSLRETLCFRKDPAVKLEDACSSLIWFCGPQGGSDGLQFKTRNYTDLKTLLKSNYKRLLCNSWTNVKNTLYLLCFDIYTRLIKIPVGIMETEYIRKLKQIMRCFKNTDSFLIVFIEAFWLNKITLAQKSYLEDKCRFRQLKDWQYAIGLAGSLLVCYYYSSSTGSGIFWQI